MARPKMFDRIQMLDRAMELFWDRGYEATSIHDLLTHLGINRQSLYDTFGDKHMLFIEALKRYDEVGNAPILAILEGPGSGKDAIERAFRYTVQSCELIQPRLGCFIVNSTIELAPHDPEVAHYVSKSFARIQQAFSHALNHAWEQGELHTERDLESMARFLTTVLQGLHVSSRAGTDIAILHNTVDIALSALA